MGLRSLYLLKMKSKDLEETIKDKVIPLVEETMEKILGITIPKMESDLTDRLTHSPFEVYFPPNISFKRAKKIFKREFFSHQLQLHLGNVSQVAKDLGVDRRSVHRAIKELKIDLGKVRTTDLAAYQASVIDKTLRSTFDEYKKIIHPQKMEQMYQDLPALSRNIAKIIPPASLSWQAAQKEFEKQFLQHALEEVNGVISLAAKKINIQPETLHRKVKKLGLK